MSSLNRYLKHHDALMEMSKTLMLRTKGGMVADMMSPSVPSAAADWQQQSKNRESYAFFRSWVYAAVHALGLHAGKQPVHVGRSTSESIEKFSLTQSKVFGGTIRKLLTPKQKLMMPLNIRNKAADSEVELITDHKLNRLLSKPNPLQHKFQFVYSFVANLNLTGRAYIIRDEVDGQECFYSLPSTWVRPDHSQGVYSKFYVVNPKNLDYVGQGEPIDAANVAWVHLPNPADPMGSVSPANSQSAAVRVDDRIQTCKEKFFDNGVFPSVIVTIGKNPHPDVPGGMRPRLTAAQRRQVNAAIRKGMGSVSNYGNVAIVDGLIEAITPFSRAQSDLGWEKSEGELKTRILSAFGVHPFILGEPVGVGGYAQTYNIMSVFYDRVNVFLDMLSVLMTDFYNQEAEDEIVEVADETLIWWEEAQAKDPSMEWSNWNQARGRNDITRNELRSRLGLPAIEGENEQVIPKDTLSAVAAMIPNIGTGLVRPDQAQAFFEACGVPQDYAARMAGANSPQQAMDEAVGALGQAVAALREPINQKAERMLLELSR